MNFEISDLEFLTKLNDMQSRIIENQDKKIRELFATIKKQEESHDSILRQLKNCTSTVMRMQTREIDHLRMESSRLKEELAKHIR